MNEPPQKIIQLEIHVAWIHYATKAGEATAAGGGATATLLTLFLAWMDARHRHQQFKFDYRAAARFGLKNRRTIRKYLESLQRENLVEIEFPDRAVPRIRLRGRPDQVPAICNVSEE